MAHLSLFDEFIISDCVARRMAYSDETSRFLSETKKALKLLIIVGNALEIIAVFPKFFEMIEQSVFVVENMFANRSSQSIRRKCLK